MDFILCDFHLCTRNYKNTIGQIFLSKGELEREKQPLSLSGSVSVLADRS
jgi:hypothetical protein